MLHGFTSESDPTQANLRKVVECFECLNAIPSREEDNYNDHMDAIFPNEGKVTDGISDLLPFFKDTPIEDVNQDLAVNEIKYEDDERVQRENPAYGNKQVSVNTHNNTRYEDGKRIIEIIKHTTITEEELKKGIG